MPALGMRSLSFKRPEETEDERLKRERSIARREGMWGVQETALEEAVAKERENERLGLRAISDIREADKFAKMAREDLAGIEAKRVSEQLDPEAMKRFQSSAPLQEHIRDLEMTRDRPKDIQGMIFEEGLSQQPDVSAFLKNREAGQTADIETQKAQQESAKKQQAATALQQFAEKHGLRDEAQRDLINLLANIGETEEGIKQAIELSGREAGKVETLQEQDFDVEKENLLQDNRKELERLKQKGRQELEQTKSQLKIKFQQDKPLERKSTTQSAKILAENGFALENMQILRDLLKSNDVNILKTSALGNFTNPKLVNVIEQLTEIHGREASGAAISASEWKNFRKQILNKKFLLTNEGKKEALENIDRFVGRYFAKAELVSQDPDWFTNYKEARQRGVEALGGGSDTDTTRSSEIGLTGDKATRLEELRRKQREGTLK